MSKRDVIRKCIAVVVAIAMTLVMMQVNGREIVAYADDSSNEGNTDKYIDTIEITMNEPEATNTPDQIITRCSTKGIDILNYTKEWTPSLDKNGYFKYDTTYNFQFEILASVGYKIDYKTKVTLNGAESSYRYDDYNCPKIYVYTTCIIPKAKFKNIIKSYSTYEFPFGTSYDTIKNYSNFPENVIVDYGSYKQERLPVKWDTSNIEDLYNPNTITEQNFQLKGTVELPDYVENDSRTVETYIDIRINKAELPKITTQPANRDAYVGDAVTFSVEASGDNLTYQWQVDKNGINDFEDCTNSDEDCVAYGIKYTGEQSNTLKISSVSYIMSNWKYRCVVTNSAGSVESTSATLTVEYYTPPMPEYAIELDVGSGGTVKASEYTYIYDIYAYAYIGDTPTLSINPNEGYEIDSLYVDEKSVELDNRKQVNYTFAPIYANHKLKVTFRKINNSQSIYKIKLDIGIGGSLTINTNYDPKTQTTTVKAGNDVTFKLYPSDGYVMESLIIDGESVALTDVYTFTNVQSDHTLKTTYKKISSNLEPTTTEAETKPKPTESDTEPTTKPSPRPTPEPVTEPETETEIESETVSKTYDILDGADSKWTYNSSDNAEGLSIRGAGSYANFKNIKVDGKIVDKSNYTVREGSTIITLKPDYLETISDGNHSFEMIWTDGHATTEFTVDKRSNDNKDDSKDNNNKTDGSDNNDSKTDDSTNNNPKDNGSSKDNDNNKADNKDNGNTITADDKNGNNKTDSTADSTTTQEPVIKPDKVSTDNKNVKSADNNKNNMTIAPQTSDIRDTSAIIYLILLITSFVTALITRFKKN